jgi:predicted phage terminase large subunit-like protein
MREVRPQPRQEQFLSTPADIAIFGGSAGGGKTYSMLWEPLKHYHRPSFFGVIFRRQETDIYNAGGLWDASCEFYPHLGARGSRANGTWTFPSMARIQFSHLQHEHDKYDWQGTGLAFIGFEELTHFSAGQFWYLMSRLRSMSGVRPYVRATCNPDPDSFVATMVSWWIDQETGYAIPERSGVVRWFIRLGDDLIWSDDRTQLSGAYPSSNPRSFTFVMSTLRDNPALTSTNPEYRSSLESLPHVDRLRLLGEGDRGGNWKVRATAGMVFRRDWFEIVEASPANARRVRHWDMAATEPTIESQDPDWTAGVRVARDERGVCYVEDVRRMRVTAGRVEAAIQNTASQDGQHVTIGLFQDPAQAGKAQIVIYMRLLAQYVVRTVQATRKVEAMAGPVSAQAEHGNIKLVRGPWNDAFLTELENFPSHSHDDQVAALCGAHTVLTSSTGAFSTSDIAAVKTNHGARLFDTSVFDRSVCDRTNF